MKKLYLAAPVLTLVGAWVISSCVGGDSGTGNGGLGGAGPTGQGGAAGATPGMGGMTSGSLGGMTGDGGMTGAGGSATPGGAGGKMTDAGGAGLGGMTGAGGSLLDAAKVLDGQMLVGACRNDTQASVCGTAAGACPAANAADPALSGVLTTNKMLTMGGTTGQSYSITLHVQGVVESKQYPNGGIDQNATALTPKADGFCTGGIPTGANAYNVYMLRVTNPGQAKKDYFFNSLQAPYVSNHTVYGIDYIAKIPGVMAGAALRLVAADSNCSMIKNCGPLENDGTTCGTPIIPAGIEPTAVTLNPTFNFNAAFNGQWIVFTVKDVSSP